jgi:hypothetical protein
MNALTSETGTALIEPPHASNSLMLIISGVFMLHFTPISMFGKNKTKIVPGQENVSVQLARLAFPTLMAKKIILP